MSSSGLELLRSGLDDLMRDVSRPGLAVVVLASVPSRPQRSTDCVASLGSILWRRPCAASHFEIPRDYVEVIHGRTNAVLHDLSRRWPNVFVEFPHEFMCNASNCITYLNGEFLYTDDNHIRRNLSEVTQERLADILQLRAMLVRARQKASLLVPTPGP